MRGSNGRNARTRGNGPARVTGDTSNSLITPRERTGSLRWENNRLRGGAEVRCSAQALVIKGTNGRPHRARCPRGGSRGRRLRRRALEQAPEDDRDGAGRGTGEEPAAFVRRRRARSRVWVLVGRTCQLRRDPVPAQRGDE